MNQELNKEHKASNMRCQELVKIKILDVGKGCLGFDSQQKKWSKNNEFELYQSEQEKIGSRV